jgi:uncharacterized protein
MLFNVAQLLKEPTGAVRRHELNEDLTQVDPELRFLGPLIGTLQLLRTNSGILVTGNFSTAVQTNCNRCVEPIAQEVRFSLEENFRPLTEVTTGRYLRPEEFEGEEEDLEDAALLIDERHILSIAEVVRQAIWLALPMYPGCNWFGAGDCPNLLKRLDELDQLEDIGFVNDPRRTAEEEIDPRWAALLKLRDDAGSRKS